MFGKVYSLLGKRKKSDARASISMLSTMMDKLDFNGFSFNNTRKQRRQDKKTLSFFCIVSDAHEDETIRETYKHIADAFRLICETKKNGKKDLNSICDVLATSLFEKDTVYFVPLIEINDFVELHDSLEFHNTDIKQFSKSLDIYNAIITQAKEFVMTSTIMGIPYYDLIKHKIVFDKNKTVV